eukprot:TRINITY_DN21865_c0_g1_i1.p1 TRINITY_DN21865_c0_g1~~TRINITY_DN21865_c0_g1_i1.p1  ORF type:complete len:121 (+),score=42.56 TRINITY_DN21865_c0_g1_i1:1-363(+)
MRFQTRLYEDGEMCTAAARDFVFVHNWKEFEDGKIVLASKSVKHPAKPENKQGKVIRAKAHILGWVIEPIVDASGKVHSSKLIYLNQVDLGGVLPKWMIDLVEKQQPMLIHQIRKLFGKS